MIDVDSGFQLAVIKGEDRGRNIDLVFREIHLGRKSSGAQLPHWIYFAEPTVSRHHATLVWDDVRRSFTVYHKSRTNPTLVNGKRILHCPLAHDDVVQIGLLVFRVEYIGTHAAAADAAARGVPSAVNPPPNPRRQPELEDSEDLTGGIQSGLRLVVTAGPDQGSVFPMTSTVLFIGRRSGLDDLRGTNGILLNDDGLPKEQVLLAWNEREQTYGIFQVESSTLPTRVERDDDGELESILLGPNNQMLLQPNDVIRMGETAILYELDSDGADEVDPQVRETLYMKRPTVAAADDGVYDDAEDDDARDFSRSNNWGTSDAPPRRGAWPEPAPATPRAAAAGWPADPTRRSQHKRRDAGDEPAPSREPADGLMSVGGPLPPTPAAPLQGGRRRREPAAPRAGDDRGEQASTLPRPAIQNRPPSPPPEPQRNFPRPAPAPPPPPPMEPEDDEADEGPQIDDAPFLPSALEPIRFPALDVNFVRNLPTRGGETPRPAPPRPQPADDDDDIKETITKPWRPQHGQAPSDEPPAPTRRGDSGPSAPRAAADAPGLPSDYRPPEFAEEDEDGVEGLDFKDATFAWRYRADYILGFLEGPNRGQKIELLTRELQDGRQITVGSVGGRVNDIEVDDRAVASEQATITYASGRFTLLNEGRDGSIFLNQIAVGQGEEMLLKTGDRIGMGESVLIFLERSVVQILSKYELNVVAGIPEDRGRSYDLLREVVVIGRNKSCDVALADPEVSRKHVAITLRNGRFYLTHMSTSNPTFINGISLPRGRDRILNEGDKIQVSDHTTLQFRARSTRG